MLKEIIIPEGWKGTKKTIAEMWELVNDRSKTQRLRNIAMTVIKDVPGKDYLGEANAIFEFVKKRTVFRRDPDGVEWVSDPFLTLQDKLGDCDDQSILVASLAKSVGFPVRFVTIRTNSPDFYNHVFSEIYVPRKGWLAADTTEAVSYLGWKPDAKYGETIWQNPLNERIGNMAGMTQSELKAKFAWAMQKGRTDDANIKMVGSQPIANEKIIYYYIIYDPSQNSYFEWSQTLTPAQRWVVVSSAPKSAITPAQTQQSVIVAVAPIPTAPTPSAVTPNTVKTVATSVAPIVTQLVNSGVPQDQAIKQVSAQAANQVVTPTAATPTQRNVAVAVASTPAAKSKSEGWLPDLSTNLVPAVKNLVNSGVPQDQAVKQVAAEAAKQISEPERAEPKPSKTKWIVAGAGAVAVLGSIIYFVTKNKNRTGA